MPRSFRLPWLAALPLLPVATLTPASAQSPVPSAVPSASSSAPAPPLTTTVEAAPEQVVWLSNGAIVRGQVVELVPQDHVTLLLATGDIRTVPWADILRSSFLPTSTTPPLSAPPTAASTPPPPTPPKPGVTIELLGDRPGLWLESRRRFTNDPWTIVCRAPCDRPIPVHDLSLRVAGTSVRPSNAFFIDGTTGHEVLVARTGDAETHVWGQRSLVGGIGLGLAGGMSYGLGQIKDSDPAVVGGLISMIAGGALIAVALPLLGMSSTQVKNSKGDRIGRADSVLVW